MKSIKIKVQATRKETPQERKERVRNDHNHAHVHANKKAYKRHKKHKGGEIYE